MKGILDRVLNYEVLISGFIGAIGYGLSYAILENLGLNTWICVVVCLICGSLTDIVGNKIVSSKVFKDSRKNRLYAAIIVYLIYFAAWLFVHELFHKDLDEDLLFDFLFVLAFQLIAIFIQYIKRKIKKGRNA